MLLCNFSEAVCYPIFYLYKKRRVLRNLHPVQARYGNSIFCVVISLVSLAPLLYRRRLPSCLVMSTLDLFLAELKGYSQSRSWSKKVCTRDMETPGKGGGGRLVGFYSRTRAEEKQEIGIGTTHHRKVAKVRCCHFGCCLRFSDKTVSVPAIIRIG